MQKKWCALLVAVTALFVAPSAAYADQPATITLREFHRLAIGMDYDQARAVIGGNAASLATATIRPDLFVVSMTWNGERGAATLLFRGSDLGELRLTDMQQSGLPGAARWASHHSPPPPARCLTPAC